MELSDYARRQMAFRGIGDEQVEGLLDSVEPFTYRQRGVEHVGYYDETSRLFVAAVGDVVITAFFTRPAYVAGLRRRGS